MTRVAALLAAGGGSRFLGPVHKLLAPLGDATVWEQALRRVTAAGFDHVVVITGAVDLHAPTTSDDSANMTTTPPPPVVTFRHNPDWAQGQAGSVQLAVAAADELGADRVTIGLADQPFVTEQAWRTVADAPDNCRIVIATYDGQSGPNPVRLDRSVWPLLPRSGDAGARHVITEHPSWVCRVACVGSSADIDTLEDLDRWKSC